VRGVGMRRLVVVPQTVTWRPVTRQPAKAGRRRRRARLRVREPAPRTLAYPVRPVTGVSCVGLELAGNGFAAAPLGGCEAGPRPRDARSGTATGEMARAPAHESGYGAEL
jgi:hypothetical protein